MGWMNRSEARADREAARQAQFADRIRELAAKLCHGAATMMVGAELQSSSSVQVSPLEWDTWRSELRLIVRNSETVVALDGLSSAVVLAVAFLAPKEDDNAERARVAAGNWKQAQLVCQVALKAFEQAVQVELGVAQKEALRHQKHR
jgi:hypothetical protein